MMIQKFNNNHAPDEQRPTSTVRAAKIQVAKKPVKNPTDKIILLIANVHKSINYFEIKWKNGSSLKLYFNGRYEKYKRNGKLASAGGVGSRKHTGIYENGHIFLFINGNMITFERLVAICVDFHHNCVAADYNGLLANMKDGSGSKDTADELGIPMNFHPDNIEWTTSKENGSHGYLIRELYEITGHVYRFSAYDDNLMQLQKSGQIENLKEYCQNNLFEVK